MAFFPSQYLSLAFVSSYSTTGMHTVWKLIKKSQFKKILLFVYIFSYLFTFSAVCLHFQLFVYIFSCLFTFCQLIVYIFSCLFTFVSCLFTLSADFSYLFTFCQLISAVCLLFVSWNQLFVYFLSADCLQFEFSRQKPCFSMTFLPLQMLQHFNC